MYVYIYLYILHEHAKSVRKQIKSHHILYIILKTFFIIAFVHNDKVKITSGLKQ